MKHLILTLFFLPLYIVASNDSSKQYFIDAEIKISTINKKLFSTKNETDRIALNKELIETFETTLKQTNSYSYPFDSLKKDIGILVSPDNSFRIIHWNIYLNDGTYKYFGFIQEKYISSKKAESILLFPLTDKSGEIKAVENYISDHKKWFGMLYYKIIPLKTKSKTYYTLLAWDGNDKVSQKKFIDVLSFDSNGNPRFGADIFDIPKKNPKRIVFEYAHDCKFVLKYNNELNMIVFDRLSAIDPKLEGQYQYYCTTDFEYDGFKIKKNKWLFTENIEPKNEKSRTDKLYNNPNTADSKNSNQLIDDNLKIENGKVVKKENKDKSKKSSSKD